MSEIIVTDDIEKLLENIDYDELILRDEFKIDDVREVKEKAYIKEDRKKTILLAAKKYNIISQNALLKLLEEPPENIDFILVATSKYALLDTIKSRLPVREVKFLKKEKVNVSLSNKDILDYLKDDLSKDEIKNMIYSLLNEKLNEEQMEILGNAVKMLELNIDPKAVLSLVFLALKDRK